MFKVKVFTAEQKGVKLYIGVLTAKELIERGQVDYWTPSTTDGYQRQLVPKRISEGAWYLMEGEGIFPTSVLISVRGTPEFKTEQSVNGFNIGTLELPDDEPLWIIDGQHRIEMLRAAIDRGERSLEEYQVPVTFIMTSEKFQEMRYFYLVNSRANPVPTSIAERLLQQVYKEKGQLWLLENESAQIKKSERAVLRARATNVVDYLLANCEVWKNMIEVPGEAKPDRYAVKQHTLVTTFLEGPFKENSIARLDDDSIGQLLDSYWSAIAEVFQVAIEEPESHSIRRTAGLYALHMIFPDIFERCRETRDYSQKKMVEILGAMAIDSSFWHTDSKVGDIRTFGTGMKSLRLLADYLREFLPKLTLEGL